MEIRLLQTLALLKVNWDSSDRMDYVDIFVPILVQCIKAISGDVISSGEISALLRKKFGMSLPISIIEVILKRIRKKGLIVLDNHTYRRNNLALIDYDKISSFTPTQNSLTKIFDDLVCALVKYASDAYEKIWTSDVAERALFEWLEVHGYTALAALISGVPLKQAVRQRGKKATECFVVSSFVLGLEQSGDKLFQHFESIVQGNILASSIYLPDLGRIAKRIANTKFYFDTTLLANCLGYGGNQFRQASIELVNLLKAANGKIFCFDRTVIELKGIIDACAERLASPDYGSLYGHIGSHFASIRANHSDLVLIQQTMDEKIRELGVIVTSFPAFDQNIAIDERGLYDKLSGEIRYQNEYALDHDAKAISSILRMRGGRESALLEDCDAVFVTTNLLLARVTKSLFLDHARRQRGIIPPCISDQRLSAQLWLKLPNSAPNLPRKRIIADCYASIQPSRDFWGRYIGEIDKLKLHGSISEADYYLLRYDFDARKRLMNATQGDAESFSDEGVFFRGTIQEILKYAHEQITSELLERHELELSQARAQHEIEKQNLISNQRAAEAVIKQLEVKIKELKPKAEKEKSFSESEQGNGEPASKIVGASVWKAVVSIASQWWVISIISGFAVALLLGVFFVPEYSSWRLVYGVGVAVTALMLASNPRWRYIKAFWALVGLLFGWNILPGAKLFLQQQNGNNISVIDFSITPFDAPVNIALIALMGFVLFLDSRKSS